jgi:hypothetical protein
VAESLPAASVVSAAVRGTGGPPEDRLQLGAAWSPEALDQAGWGVIFAYDARPDVREALGELLEHRQAQAGPLYREYMGPYAFRPGETKWQFLARNGAGTGPPDPLRMPYYLLIVGDPETIPFEFQYQLDVQYAVGRLYFDAPQEYARYARGVVAAESTGLALPRRAVLFAPEHPGDAATRLTTDQLIKPLAEELRRDQAAWQVGVFGWNEATRERLRDLMADAPALLMTAGHGLIFPLGDGRQRDETGSFVCQDWPGPWEWGRKPLPPEFIFGPTDVGDGARLLGSVAFLFHDYSAGAPQMDDFPHPKLRERPKIAPSAFVSRLSQRLLAHPNGGMLAVIGHVERLWAHSFQGPRAVRELAVFSNALKVLMEGRPVGMAMHFFNARYAELATMMAAEIETRSGGMDTSDREFNFLLTALKDARNYIVLGDPAARLGLADPGVPPPRLTLAELGR